MKKIIAFVLVLAMAFGFAACGEDVTSEKYIAKKTEEYNTMLAEEKFAVAEGMLVVEGTTEGVTMTIKLSDTYFYLGSKAGYLETVKATDYLYVHVVTAAVEANEDLGIQASDAVDEWYKTPVVDGEQSLVDSLTESYKEFGDFSDVAAAKFIETVKVDGVQLDHVQLTGAVEEEEETAQVMDVYVDAKTGKIVKAEMKDEENDIKITFGAKTVDGASLIKDVKAEEADSETLGWTLFAILMAIMLG